MFADALPKAAPRDAERARMEALAHIAEALGAKAMPPFRILTRTRLAITSYSG